MNQRAHIVQKKSGSAQVHTGVKNYMLSCIGPYPESPTHMFNDHGHSMDKVHMGKNTLILSGFGTVSISLKQTTSNI
jgi:hypothetical protein